MKYKYSGFLHTLYVHRQQIRFNIGNNLHFLVISEINSSDFPWGANIEVMVNV